MPRRSERESRFFRPQEGELPRELMMRMKRTHPHQPHSVLVLVVSACGQYLLLCRPHKVLERMEIDAYRVPVQQKMYRAPDPVAHAQTILRMRADLRVDREKLSYIGCGFTTHYIAGGASHRFNKCLHVVMCVAGDANGSYETGYGRFDWCHISSLPGFLQFCMDERKAQLLRWSMRAAADEVYVNPQVREAFLAA